MNNKNWKYYRKLAYGQLVESNLLYTPTVNPKGNIMCMHYCFDTDYRFNTPSGLTIELINWFFDKEARFLSELQHLDCTPMIHEIDFKNKKIFIEFNNETLSQIINDPNRSIDQELPDWKEQLQTMFTQFSNEGYYKVTLYPHCFYIDSNKQIKTIDYYAVVPYTERYVERKVLQGVIGPSGASRFDESTTAGLLDFKKFHELTVNKHIDQYWPHNPFKEVYKEVYND